jgi:hypothetical protein
MGVAIMSDIVDKMETADGRKVLNAATNELSVSLESTEQKEKGRLAKLQADELELKLKALKRPVFRTKLGRFPRF